MTNKLRIILQPFGKTSFISKMSRGAKVLDVGCGNDSASRLKKMRSDIYYIGLDIDHQNTGNKQKNDNADEMHITKPENFHKPIEDLFGEIDYIISSHNLEHCQDREKILKAMAKALKVGGLMYLSFPSIKSQTFPNRVGPLNYYDEKEHTETPPDPEKICNILKLMNCEIIFQSLSYRPPILAAIGFLVEPISRMMNRTLIGTWQFYGFESIFWIRKI
jgi:2-polyprenyl-3-methyl-5-hydroxy-6-metoxy-1,4-benzoquinol methylase